MEQKAISSGGESDNHLAKLTKIKSEKTEISTIKNETGDITTDSVTIEKKEIRRVYDLDKMDQFIKNHELYVSLNKM